MVTKFSTSLKVFIGCIIALGSKSFAQDTKRVDLSDHLDNSAAQRSFSDFIRARQLDNLPLLEIPTLRQISTEAMDLSCPGCRAPVE